MSNISKGFDRVRTTKSKSVGWQTKRGRPTKECPEEEMGKSRSWSSKYVCSFLKQVYNYVVFHCHLPLLPSSTTALITYNIMFHIATHPTSFAMHGHGHHQVSMPMSSPNTQLPRTLSRPSFNEVSREAIMAVAPELTNVPAEYIRRGLRSKTHQYVSRSISLQTRANMFHHVECSLESHPSLPHICPPP